MIKTIFMGTPEFSMEALRYLYEKTKLELIVTKEDKINKRGKNIDYSPVKKFAIDNGIEYIQPKSLKNEEIKNIIENVKADLIVVAAYGKIIPQDIIDMPRLGIINVHSSILPKYRGASPIHNALLNGDTKTGISIMMIDAGLDTGDVLEIKEIDILEEDNLETLTNKLTKEIYNLLDIAITKLIKGTETRTKQNEELATITKPITKEEAKILWTKSNFDIHNLVRALSPKPASYTFLNNERIKIYKTEKIEKEYEKKVGEVVEITKKGPIVKCGVGALKLLEVQFEGKKIQTGSDIVNGRKIKKGDVFHV